MVFAKAPWPTSRVTARSKRRRREGSMFQVLAARPFRAYLPLLIVAVACGCAHKRELAPYVSVEPAMEYPSRMAVTPAIVTDAEPIKFISFTAAEHIKDRAAAEEERQRRIDSRLAANTRRDMADLPRGVGTCVAKTFIIFSPVCAVIIPGALVASNAWERRSANRDDPAMAALPSERELLQVQETISRRFTTDRLMEHILGVSQVEGDAMQGASYPRLVIRTESARLTMAGMMEIQVSARG